MQIRSRTAIATAVCVLTIGVLSACTGTENEEPTPNGGTSSPSADATGPTDAPFLENDEDIAGVTTITSCEALPDGGGVAIGTVANSTDEEATYSLIINFKSGDDYVGWAQGTVVAAADSDAPWVAQRAFSYEASDDETIECELNAVSVVTAE